MSRCFIFAAGTFFGLRERPCQDDYVIAADGGLKTVKQEGIIPNLILGDFDSLARPENDDNVLVFPVEKDDTDSMLAIREGLRLGYRSFVLYGASGGQRLDHTLANLQSLLFLARAGARGILYDNNFAWTVLENGTLVIPRAVDWQLLSVFSMGDRAEGLTISGVQYPAEDIILENAYPLAVSNHILAEKAVITLRKGTVLVGYELPKL